MNEANKERRFSISELSEAFGLKRDAYYKYQRRDKKSVATNATVLSMIMERRKDQAREGVRKMHKACREVFHERGIKVGRVRLFEILRDHDMLVKNVLKLRQFTC
jgi:putative transposase